MCRSLWTKLVPVTSVSQWPITLARAETIIITRRFSGAEEVLWFSADSRGFSGARRFSGAEEVLWFSG
jgi:hypothetical protein